MSASSSLDRFLPARTRAAAAVAIAALAVASLSPGSPAGPGAAAADPMPDPVGAHSMLQLNDPPALMEAMFAQAVALHAGAIRLDVAPALVFADPHAPDWTGLDAVVALSRRYGLRVLADLTTIPAGLADCAAPASWPDTTRCGTDDLAAYGADIGAIVARAAPVIGDWELWNEPDASAYFNGTPQQYAWMLRTAHDAITSADPAANVLLGGISGVGATGWLAAVFATPGADAVSAFDTANLHERGALDQLAGDLTGFRRFLAGAGFTGPLWVTEHGYPSDPAYQYDPAFAGGAAGQAAYLRASIPTLLDAGAAAVFVTERDNLGGQFASEGLLGPAAGDPSALAAASARTQAFGAVQAIAGCYAALGHDCPGPAPSPSPAVLTPAPAALGTGSDATVTLTAPGPGPALTQGATIDGAPPGQFAIAADTCSFAILEPGLPCAITIRYTPSIAGAVSAVVSLGTDTGPVWVGIDGVAPSVSSLVASTGRTGRGGTVSLASVRDGSMVAQRTAITLVNPLSAPVAVTGAALSRASGGRFLLGLDACVGATLAPGASCRVAVTFITGLRTAASARLTLRGSGRPLALAVRVAAPTRRRPLRAGRQTTRTAPAPATRAVTVSVSR